MQNIGDFFGKLTTPTKAEDDTNTYTFDKWTWNNAAITYDADDAFADVFGATTTVNLVATYTATAKPVTPSYTSALQEATYNGIEATVVRITGLDTTKVVTVDNVTAMYYTKTDGSIVHIACVPRNAAPVISVADGTPELIIFGDYDGTDGVQLGDVNAFAKAQANFVSNRGQSFTLPTDLSILIKMDVDGNGKVELSDVNALGKAQANFVSNRGQSFTLATMGCYSK